MVNKNPLLQRPELEAEELRGFARSIAELHWLLLILVMLYFHIPTGPLVDAEALVVTMSMYGAFILVSRYMNFQRRETRLRIAIETWVMIAFITAVLAGTGHVESPLLNLYLLVIIACAITLGKLMTLLEVGLIASCYMFLGFRSFSVDIFSPETFTLLMAKLSPFLLVAYVTSMLASDILAARRKMMRMSQTDDLTGLLNMRAFNMLLEQEITRARGHRRPLTVIMIDLDGLKAVNDQYGHGAGSELISSIATRLADSIRSRDTLARYGGDEFVVMMSHTSVSQAKLAAERLRKAVNETVIEINGKRITTTASIGIASFPDCLNDVDHILDKADIALYRSKQDGRNRVSFYQPQMEQHAICA